MRVYLRCGDHYDVDVDGDVAGATCIFESHAGWHNVYRVIDLAVAHGMVLNAADRTMVEAYRSSEPLENDCTPDIADSAEAYLNDHLIPNGGWSFGWHDGEFYLANTAWWELD